MANIATYRLTCKNAIRVLLVVAFFLLISVHCKKDPTPNNDLSDRIQQLVKSLEYPDNVAEDFTRMVMDWKDEQRCPLLLYWKKILSNAHHTYQHKKISRRIVAKIEESVLREISETIEKQFSNQYLAFELSDIIQNRQMNCLGYTQLMYIIGNAIGLTVRPIEVLEPARSARNYSGHVACIIDLSDGQSQMADMLLLYETPSSFFTFEDYYIEAGNYWKLRYNFNRVRIHRKIRLLDRKGLLAGIYNSRGYVYHSKGEYDRAILEYSKAIEIDRLFVKVCINRGDIYASKDEYDLAILDYTKAIEINPKDTNIYVNRGLTYVDKFEYDRAILDFTQAIKLNPKLASAYINRGGCYHAKDEYDQAMLDITQAIELNPQNADAYLNRGGIYEYKGEYDLAILDYTKAIEIDPGFAVAHLGRGEVYAELGKSEEAKKDLLKTLELDPELRESVKKISEHYELDLNPD